MIKNSDKLKFVEPILAQWLRAFEKDYNYELTTKGVNIIVTEGIRDLETQKKYLATGKSKTLKSKHLKNKNGLSQAIDIAFEINGRINWNDMTWWMIASKHFTDYFKARGISATHGADWNKNGKYTDEKFLDAPHFQLDLTPTEEPKIVSTVNVGDNGEIVKTIQNLLIAKGYKLVADGSFGKNTLVAVKDFQSKNGLLADGIVGYKTLDKLKGK